MGKPSATSAAARPIIIIKKKKGHGAHHGGAWKVAYADFVTAMMALFMVLWLVSQTDQVEREVISHYFRTGIFPDGGTSLLEQGEGIQDGKLGMMDSSNSLVEVRAEQQKLENAAEQMKKAVAEQPTLKELLDNIQVRTIERGLLIELVDGGKDTLFELSSSALKTDLIRLLEAIAPTLESLQNPLEIHGHTDVRPFPVGAGRDNWSLSFERAAAARLALERAGVRDQHFAGVFAHGSKDLFEPKEPMAATNRRISILAVRSSQKMVGLSAAPTVTREMIERALHRNAKTTSEGQLASPPAPNPAAPQNND